MHPVRERKLSVASETPGLEASAVAAAAHRPAVTPRRIFVSEYVCGGGWPEKAPSQSLAVQGRAMLLAVISDLLQIPGCSVVTTWDRRLGPFPQSPRGPQPEVCLCDSTDELSVFERLCRNSEAALVIAPEFHGILAQRVTTAARVTTLIGPDPATVRLCADKLRLADFLFEHDIPTVPAQPLNPVAPEVAWSFPIVVKPRDGAGSVATHLIRNVDEFKRCCELLCPPDKSVTDEPAWTFIQQPFRSGENLSGAVVIGLDGTREILPVCRQTLSRDGQFQYMGADRDPSQAARWHPVASTLIDSLLTVIPGSSGFLGFDLISTAANSLEIVDINPRFTAGYLGWRMWTRENIACRLLKSGSRLKWIEGSGQFRVQNLH